MSFESRIERSASQILSGIGIGRILKLALFTALATWSIASHLGFPDAGFSQLGQLAGIAILVGSVAGLGAELTSGQLRYPLALVARLAVVATVGALIMSPDAFLHMWLVKVGAVVGEWIGAFLSFFAGMGLFIATYGLIIGGGLFVLFIMDIGGSRALIGAFALALNTAMRLLVLGLLSFFSGRLRTTSAGLAELLVMLVSRLIKLVYLACLWLIFGTDGMSAKRSSWASAPTQPEAATPQAKPWWSWQPKFAEDPNRKVSRADKEWLTMMEKGLKFAIGINCVFHGNSKENVQFRQAVAGGLFGPPEPLPRIVIKGRLDRSDPQYALFSISFKPTLTDDSWQRVQKLDSFRLTLSDATRENPSAIASFYEFPYEPAYTEKGMYGLWMRVMIPRFRSSQAESQSEPQGTAPEVVATMKHKPPFGWRTGQSLANTTLSSLTLIPERTGLKETSREHAAVPVERYTYKLSIGVLSDGNMLAANNDKPLSVEKAKELYNLEFQKISLRQKVDGDWHWTGNEVSFDFLLEKKPMPKMVRFSDWINRPEFADFPNHPGQVIVGASFGGRAITADLLQQPHSLIVGPTGGGKSSIMNSLISQLSMKSPSLVRLLLVDPKGTELPDYADLPHTWMLAYKRAEIEAAMMALEKEMDARVYLFRNVPSINGSKPPKLFRHVSEWNAYCVENNEPGMQIPYVYALIDEFEALTTGGSSKEQHDLAQRIQRLTIEKIALGRSMGIHFLLCAQKGSANVFRDSLRSNTPGRFVLPNPNEGTLQDWRQMMSVPLSEDEASMRDESGDIPAGRGAFLDRARIKNFVQFLFPNTETIREVADRATRRWKQLPPGSTTLVERGILEGVSYVAGHTDQASVGSEPADEFQSLRQIVRAYTAGNTAILSRRQLAKFLALPERRANELLTELKAAGIVTVPVVEPGQLAQPARLLILDEAEAVAKLAAHRGQAQADEPQSEPQPTWTEPQAEPIPREPEPHAPEPQLTEPERPRDREALQVIEKLILYNPPMIITVEDLAQRFSLPKKDVSEVLKWMVATKQIGQNSDGTFSPK